MMRAVRISPHPHQQYFGAGLELGFPCVSFVRLVVAAYELVVDDEKYGCNQDENNATHDNFVRESAPSHGNEHPPALSDVIVRFVQSVSGVNDGLTLRVEVSKNFASEFLCFCERLPALPDTFPACVDACGTVEQTLPLSRGGGREVLPESQLRALCCICSRRPSRRRRTPAFLLEVREVGFVVFETSEKCGFRVGGCRARFEVHSAQEGFRLGDLGISLSQIVCALISSRWR